MRDKRILLLADGGSIALRYEFGIGRIVMGGLTRYTETIINILSGHFMLTEAPEPVLAQKNKVQFHVKRRYTFDQYLKALKSLEQEGIANTRVTSLERIMR